MEDTVQDFWQMIWENQGKIIIQLTDLSENGVARCAEYLPPSEVLDCHRLYGDYQVCCYMLIFVSTKEAFLTCFYFNRLLSSRENYAITTSHLTSS